MSERDVRDLMDDLAEVLSDHYPSLTFLDRDAGALMYLDPHTGLRVSIVVDGGND